MTDPKALHSFIVGYQKDAKEKRQIQIQTQNSASKNSPVKLQDTLQQQSPNRKSMDMNYKVKTEDSKKMAQELQDLRTNLEVLKYSIRETYSFVNEELKQTQLKEFFLTQWDLDYQNKEPQELLPLIRSMVKQGIKNIQNRENDTDAKLNEQKQKQTSTNPTIQDYIQLLQKSEADNRKNLRENQQLKLQIEIYQEKLKNSEKQGQVLAEKTQKKLEDINIAFNNAIETLSEREKDVQLLEQEIKRQQEVIQSMDERLVSIFILEHKIRAIGQKNTKDIEKVIFEYEEKLNQLAKQNHEQLREERILHENSISDLKKKMMLSNQENKHLKFENKSRIQQLNDIISEREDLLQKRVSQLQTTKEKLASRNKELFSIFNKKQEYGRVFEKQVHTPNNN